MNPDALKKLTIYRLLVCLVFILSFLYKWNSPPFPYFHYDSGSFLFSTLDFLNNGTINCYQDNRNFFYPMFLGILLKTSQTLKIVPFAQHILGLVAGFFLFKILQLFYEELKPGSGISVALKTGSLIILILYLFSHSVNLYEHHILAESLIGILLFSAVYTFLKSLRHENAYWYIPSFFTIYCICYLQPRHLLSCIVCSCILLYYLFRENKNFIVKTSIILVSAALIVLLLFLPNRIYKKGRTEVYSGFVVASKADILYTQFKDDLSSKKKLKYDKKLIQQIAEHFSNMLQLKPYPDAPRVGFPMYIYFNSIPEYLTKKFDNDLKAMDRFFQHYIFKSIRFQTRLWIKILAEELSMFYLPNTHMFEKIQTLSPYNLQSMERIQFQKVKFETIKQKYDIMNEYIVVLETDKKTYTENYFRIEIIEKTLQVVSITFIPLLLLFLILYRQLGRFYKDNIFVHVTYVLNLFIFLTCFTSAFVASLQLHRFIEDMIAIILLTYFFMLMLLINYVISLIKQKKILPIIHKNYFSLKKSLKKYENQTFPTQKVILSRQDKP